MLLPPLLLLELLLLELLLLMVVMVMVMLMMLALLLLLLLLLLAAGCGNGSMTRPGALIPAGPLLLVPSAPICLASVTDQGWCSSTPHTAPGPQQQSTPAQQHYLNAC